MILCEVNFFSEVLVSSCSMNILLPQQPLALAQAKQSTASQSFIPAAWIIRRPYQNVTPVVH